MCSGLVLNISSVRRILKNHLVNKSLNFVVRGGAESIVRYLFTILIVLLISVANKPHLSFQLLFRYK
jgi:hypothetical protein